jgi:hypothetical protein
LCSPAAKVCLCSSPFALRSPRADLRVAAGFSGYGIQVQGTWLQSGSFNASSSLTSTVNGEYRSVFIHLHEFIHLLANIMSSLCVSSSGDLGTEPRRFRCHATLRKHRYGCGRFKCSQTHPSHLGVSFDAFGFWYQKGDTTMQVGKNSNGSVPPL